MNMIERVDWDSKFFGFEIGRIVIESSEGFNFEKFKKESLDYRLVYVFSKVSLDCKEFKLVDKKVVFFQEKITVNEPEILNDIRLFDHKKHDSKQLIALTLKSGAYSRFNLDKNFQNDEYSKLYTEWILQSIKGKVATDILIALKGDKILGFTTLSKKTEWLCDIGLVAVHENARGLGIGTELIKKTLKRSLELNFNSIQVVTQLDNLPANKLYKKTNFIVKEITNIYHFWNL